jgi:hypothetical protein
MAVSQVEFNPRLPVEWCGWQSDTVTLGRCGWNLAINRQYVDLQMLGNPVAMKIPTRYEIVLSHPSLDVTLMCYDYDLQQVQIAVRMDGLMGGTHAPPIRFQHVMRRTDMVRHTPTLVPFADMAWVQTEPTIADVDTPLYRLPLFKALHDQSQAQELIVEPRDVQSILEELLKMQAPQMREVRQREQKRQVHAQIISVEAA